MKLTAENQNLLLKAGLGILAFYIFGKPILNFLGITKGAGGRKAEAAGRDINSPFNPVLWQRAGFVPNQETTRRVSLAMVRMNMAFGLLSDNEDAIIGVFKSLKSKCEVSYMAYLYNREFGQDLISKLVYGSGALPQNGLSNDELNTVFTYINRLPLK